MKSIRWSSTAPSLERSPSTSSASTAAGISASHFTDSKRRSKESSSATIYSQPLRSHWSDDSLAPITSGKKRAKAKEVAKAIQVNTRNAAMVALTPSMLAYRWNKEPFAMSKKGYARAVNGMQHVNSLTGYTLPLAVSAVGLVAAPVVGVAAGLAGITPRQRWLKPEYRGQSLATFLA